MRKTIDLHHYARFRELRGCASESVTTTATNPRELFAELGLDRTMPAGAAWLKVAVNDAFATWDDPIEHGDVVVFMMPMAGG